MNEAGLCKILLDSLLSVVCWPSCLVFTLKLVKSALDPGISLSCGTKMSQSFRSRRRRNSFLPPPFGAAFKECCHLKHSGQDTDGQAGGKCYWETRFCFQQLLSLIPATVLTTEEFCQKDPNFNLIYIIKSQNSVLSVRVTLNLHKNTRDQDVIITSESKQFSRDTHTPVKIKGN